MLSVKGLPAEADGRLKVVLPADPPARVRYGAELLCNSLRKTGYDLSIADADGFEQTGQIVLDYKQDQTDPEAFRIVGSDGNFKIIGGASGLLYGCQELAMRLENEGRLPKVLDVTDGPAFKLRGVCVGLQLTSILPGRQTYEYPITPENFPFFYDKQLWIEYLDFLFENRFNSLYLWNGHPFASLIKLDDYPYALEVPQDVYHKNVEIYRFIAQEADRRGIWLIQMFYNIFVSEPFARIHGIATQHSESTPLVLDYNRKCITRFIEQYPNVGLLVCLGEALKGQDNQEFWIRHAVIQAVKEGISRLGLQQQPPIIVRAHAVADMKALMESALKDYSNLYTMAKYNGESLTTDEPRGHWQQVHLDLSRLGSTHVVNIHLLSNLEPFRYGATEFIRRCVLACRDRLGAKGVHLYPLAYWDWPYSPDKVQPRLRQYRRDWIWFEAWGRYLWQPQPDPNLDRQYWIWRLSQVYGDRQAADLILSAYNDAGRCAPMLLRRFGITDGNRQTFSLGMFLDQFVQPEAYGPVRGLWEWYSPPGERLDEYVKKAWAGQPHEGETPIGVIADTLRFAGRARQSIDKAAELVSKNQQEFARLQNDIYCIELLTGYYAQKAKAAEMVLRNQLSQDPNDLQAALEHLARSLEIYKKLVDRTSSTYLYANSLQTGHRRIPIRGWKDEKPYYYHWEHMFPLYQKELMDFKARLSQPAHGDTMIPGSRLRGANFTLLSDNAQAYKVQIGTRPFTDRMYKILRLAEEMEGLTGIGFSHDAAKSGALGPIRFRTDVPVKVLVGYFNEDRQIWAKPPNPEVDAQAALHGGTEPVIRNALQLEGCPLVNLHVYSFEAGVITFQPYSTGSYLILGIVPAESQIVSRDAALVPGVDNH